MSPRTCAVYNCEVVFFAIFRYFLHSFVCLQFLNRVIDATLLFSNNLLSVVFPPIAQFNKQFLQRMTKRCQ